MANANGHPPTCDTAEARLLDLVYGELEDGEASAVRAHAAGCDACGRSLAKLEGGRAIARRMDTAEDAPPAVLSAVLAAARAKAGENQRATALMTAGGASSAVSIRRAIARPPSSLASERPQASQPAAWARTALASPSSSSP